MTCVPGPRHKARSRVRARRKPAPDLQVHDVVRAQRLDEMRLDRDGARPAAQRHLQRLGPDAQRQRPCRRRPPRAACRPARPGRRSPRRAPATVHPRLAAIAATLDLGDVHHRAADELRHEQVGRVGIDLFGRADLLQHALVHDHDPVGQRHRLDLVMGDIDRGRALFSTCSRFSSARISSRSLASSAPIGSSISIALGRRTSARPMATRCMSPPDSAEGRRFSRCSICSTSATRAHRARRSRPGSCRTARSGKAMFS